MQKDIKIVAVSGGFDPVHIGHVRMFNEAKKLGDKLVVILNNDNWIKLKKGAAFMPESERKEVIEAFDSVDEVIVTSHTPDATDMSVCTELNSIRPHIFANGGDRKDENDIPEYKLCDELGIEMIFNIGYGGKVQSSSWLTKAIAERMNLPSDERPWGGFETLGQNPKWWVKILKVNPGARLSLQSHEKRSELWACVEGEVVAQKGYMHDEDYALNEEKTLKPGDTFFIHEKELHRLSSETGGLVVEVAFGEPIEEDITRYMDDYDRHKK